ncbi:MAG TPA: class I SAM-dependent methyltransferase [Acidimicrobiales bacterium]|nr:class I SAM-dependent methyltransferase [Acidimicrobiales bacterium]
MTEPITLDERLVSAATHSLELLSVHLGERLGLYSEIRARGSLTPPELATGAGIDARYAREWLEQQAVAGFLAVDDPAAGPDDRRYHLPDAHAGALHDPSAADHVAPLARMVVGIAKVIDDVIAAYRTGDGVPFARYGEDLRAGQAAINRPAFTTALVEEWLPAAGDLADRLRAGGRIADLGCGAGWSTIALAGAFPDATVVGIDADAASIEDARANAAAAGVAVQLEAIDADRLTDHGPFDAVLILEALHDMARPADVLRAARRSLAAGGAVIVADEAVADAFTAPGDEIERMMYGWSILHCLPASMTERPSAAIGTVIRESTVRDLASEAGFESVEVLPVDGGFFRLYRLVG